MNRYLTEDRTGLAQLNAPVFFFGQNEHQPPCIPTWAYSGTLSSSDIYYPQNRTLPAKRCMYNNVGCDCRQPGVPIGHPAPAFPIYYTIRKCSDTEVRVTFNLFYEKDGAICFAPGPVHPVPYDVGHDFDWEGVVLIYSRDPSTALWTAETLLLSQHGGYLQRKWSEIRHTLSQAQASLPDPRPYAFARGQDHPAIYAGWLKHANYDFKRTFDWPWTIQLTSLAFRSDDWWYYASPNNLIEANASTPAGQVMQSQDWGHATSIPPRVDEGVCMASEGQRTGFTDR